MSAAPLTPEQLFDRLDGLGIAHSTHAHAPAFTVSDAVALRGVLPGAHCKCLFLKDRKGGLWLAIMLEDRRTDLRKLADAIGAPRFSFGNPDLLYEVLGVRPGSVTPFALANDAAHRVRVLLDADMLLQTPVNYHPLSNDRTTAISPDDLLRFVAACGHEARIVELAAFEQPAAP